MKIQKNFRLDQNIITALNYLSVGAECSNTTTLEVLIFREAMYRLDARQLQHIFGDEYERLMMIYATAKK